MPTWAYILIVAGAVIIVANVAFVAGMHRGARLAEKAGNEALDMLAADAKKRIKEIGEHKRWTT